jgi:dienelactone hydrolase
MLVQLWYPADHQRPSWLQRLVQLAHRIRHPRWVHTWYRAEPADALAKLPLILYLPDVSGTYDENMHLLANLASHGFALAAIRKPSIKSKRRHARALKDIDLDQAVGSASAILDAMQRVDGLTSAPWVSKFDLANIGIMGSALGGSIAAETTQVDRRCTAVANLGGPISARLVTVPYLAMLSDSSHIHATALPGPDGQQVSKSAREVLHYRRARHQAAIPKSHVIEIAGSKLEHFRNPRTRSLRSMPRERAAVDNRVRSIINTYVLAFFTTYLQDAWHPLMCVSHSPYGEVQFLSRLSTRRSHPAPIARQ